MKVALHTLGCRVNTADTMALQEAFRARNVELVSKHEAADIYVLNSCTVTHTADADARKIARRFKRQNPAAKVVVTGCYAQVSGAELQAIPEVDLVVGNEAKPDLVAMLLGHEGAEGSSFLSAGSTPSTAHEPTQRTSKRTHKRVWKSAVRPPRSHITAMPESHTRPFLKVQDGCDYSCAFCIIPRARGVSRSTSVADVLDQAMKYADLGAAEIVLTGIHLGHWGRDLSPRRPLGEMVAELADAIAADGRVRRLRLGSVEPNEVTPALIELVASHPLLCEHFHVPLQSGDDRTLKKMRRLYNADEYSDAITAIRQRIPDAAIGADVLVGHPGEDESAYNRTRKLIEGLDLTYLHVFPWSARKGTPSAAMDSRPSDQAKAERVRDLIRISGAKRHFFHRRFVGRVVEAVVLGSKAGEQPYARGISRNYIPLHLRLGAADAMPQRGTVITVEVLEAGVQRCLARWVD